MCPQKCYSSSLCYYFKMNKTSQTGDKLKSGPCISLNQLLKWTFCRTHLLLSSLYEADWNVFRECKNANIAVMRQRMSKLNCAWIGALNKIKQSLQWTKESDKDYLISFAWTVGPSLLSRTFKSRQIWSHWLRIEFKFF